MNRLISLEPSNVVAIRIEAGQKCYGQLTLRNVMYTMPVAFKLQPLIKSRYSVKPHSGIIAPLQKITVEIIYHLPPGGTTLPDSFPHSDDSFLLHSVVVPGAATNNRDYDSVPSDWFTTKKKQVFTDSGIKIMFVGSPILARLVMDGTMEEVREVLEKSDPSWDAADSVDSDGQSLLHLAIAQGRPDLVQLILEFGPDLDAQSRSGSTPIEAASEAGEALIVELLLARKACCERSPNSAFAPIHLAARNGHVEVLRLLILKGAYVDALTKDNGYTALHLAVEERKRDCARLLLASGARADSRDIVEGDTPLHIAAALGDEHMVKLLLQKGANKDIRNYARRTPYDVAAENGHSRLFDVLRLGDSLCLAARKREVRTILRLLENGAAVNGRDQHGWTALHRACFKGWVETVQALIEKGVEVDAKDEEGYTALHCAAESGHGDVIELLVKKGVDVEARTNKGVTAMQIAESLHYVGITRILVQGGASRDQNNIFSHVNPSVSGYNNTSTLGFGDKKMDFTEGDQKGGLLNKKNRTRGRVLRGSFGGSMPLAVV